MDNDQPHCIFIAAKGNIAQLQPGPHQNVYIGGVEALEPAALAQASINAVLTVMTEKDKRKTKLGQKIDELDDIQKHMAFITHDDYEFLAPYFIHAVDFIREAHSVGMNVLVHSKTGEREAAAIVAAYLISEYNLSWEEALSLVKTRRGSEQVGEKWRNELAQEQEKLRALHKPHKQT